MAAQSSAPIRARRARPVARRPRQPPRRSPGGLRQELSARLHDALGEQFPAVVRLVGAARFHALVHRYLRAAGLCSYNLNEAGAEMSAFLRADALGVELPFLADLAELEWAVVRAFHATDEPPLAAARLAAIDPAALLAGKCDSSRQWRARITMADPRALGAVTRRRASTSTSPPASACWCGAPASRSRAPIDAGRAAALRALSPGEPLGDVASTPTIPPPSSAGWANGWPPDSCFDHGLRGSIIRGSRS
jgi:hypothetical protein